jgi:hypothetical protein
MREQHPPSLFVRSRQLLRASSAETPAPRALCLHLRQAPQRVTAQQRRNSCACLLPCSLSLPPLPLRTRGPCGCALQVVATVPVWGPQDLPLSRVGLRAVSRHCVVLSGLCEWGMSMWLARASCLLSCLPPCGWLGSPNSPEVPVPYRSMKKVEGGLKMCDGECGL